MKTIPDKDLKKDCITIPISKTHSNYWIESSLPVVIMACDIHNLKVYWENINPLTVVNSSNKTGSIRVLKSKELNTDSIEELIKLASSVYSFTPTQSTEKIFAEIGTANIPREVEAKIVKSSESLKNCEYREAIKLLEPLCTIFDSSKSLKINLSISFLKLKNISKATETLLQLTEDFPDDLSLLLITSSVIAKEHGIDASIDFINKIISQTNKGRNELIALWNQLGINCKISQTYKLSLKCFKKALALDQSNSIVLSNIGICYLATNNVILGTKYLKMSIERKSKNYITKYKLARLYDLTYRPFKALEYYHDIIENSNQSIPALIRAGLIHKDLDQNTKALEYLSKATKLLGDCDIKRSLYLDISLLLLRTGDNLGAYKYLSYLQDTLLDSENLLFDIGLISTYSYTVVKNGSIFSLLESEKKPGPLNLEILKQIEHNQAFVSISNYDTWKEEFSSHSIDCQVDQWLNLFLSQREHSYAVSPNLFLNSQLTLSKSGLTSNEDSCPE